MASLPLYDAHNHLQADPLLPHHADLVETCVAQGLRFMVVNGSCESDWPHVLELARAHPQIIPSLGYHPWYVHERSAHWKDHLANALNPLLNRPAAIGEIGLDRWKPDLPYTDQEEVFLHQLQLAADLNRPATIHCLKTWGRLLELLLQSPKPACGFLLHSYGGPMEMIPDFAKLGAYFSVSGAFAHPQKVRQQTAFRAVPIDRLLIETDAPDMPLPADRVQFHLPNQPNGRPTQHPANLHAVYQFAAELREIELPAFTRQIESNFLSLFHPVLPDAP